MKHDFLVSLVFCSSAVFFTPVCFSQQDYPSRPIRFIVPFTAGGFSDIQARAVAQKMTEDWGQPVLVDNRPGASGIVGADIVAKAAPDGYTIVQVVSTHATLPSLMKKMPYDTLKDFAPVTLESATSYILLAHPKIGVKTVKELIALLKSKPQGLDYASTSNGSGSHLAGELFKLMAGVNMVHVPYKGSASAIPDVLGGHVPLMFENIVTALPHVKSGRLLGLAVTSAHRSPLAPDLPTVAESGLPGFEIINWFAVLAPAGTPKPILSKLNGEIVKILHTPEMRKRLSSEGAEPIGTTPEQCDAHIRAEMVKWGKVIKDVGIHID